MFSIPATKRRGGDGGWLVRRKAAALPLGGGDGGWPARMNYTKYITAVCHVKFVS